MMIVVAPAKLNLVLEVLRKREDGYHEIRSIVQTINLCDHLEFSSSDRLEYRCNLPAWSAHQSLVSRAAELLKRELGYKGGALIEITKRIPLSAGLGGDSSDAAAVLRGLNMLWTLKLSMPDLLQLAARLGSDVPLFLYGGSLLIEGRGEKITPIRPLPHRSVVLLKPPVPEIEGKTSRLYASLESSDFSGGEHTQAFLDNIANSSTGTISGLFNAFDRAGSRCYTRLAHYRQVFLEAGASEVHLAGSGPVLFSLFEDEMKAGEAFKTLQERGLETYLTDF